MKFSDFIQRILTDLKLGQIPTHLQNALKDQIEKKIDQQIEEALTQTLTDEDWKIYDHYQKNQPQTDPEEALDKMLTHRPEIQQTVENQLLNTYGDLLTRAEAVEQLLNEAKHDKIKR